MLCEAYIGGRSQCPDARATDRADHGTADGEVGGFLFSWRQTPFAVVVDGIKDQEVVSF